MAINDVCPMPDSFPDLYNTQSNEAWRDFFEKHPHIVLVANSDVLDPRLIRSHVPDDTLFIFFNKAYKVLHENFAGRSMLVARSGSMGANIVHRHEVDDVLRYFSKCEFAGILNIRTAADERFSPASKFNGAKVLHADLEPLLSTKYPPNKIPTSGFALIIWMRELQIKSQIVLAGFSGRRSPRWKVFDVHDWTFERAYLRLLAERKVITNFGQLTSARFEILSQQFQDASAAEIQSAINETLAARLDDALAHIDSLMSITKWQRALNAAFRRIRPKTRKQRSLDRNK
ncbi:3-deoxy-manno-octulosonate cytidylyltransferase [Rhizobium sullae]|nr:3-deoxy-manno-octulosonate cytidylyltransferase [Rhizobium sullae]